MADPAFLPLLAVPDSILEPPAIHHIRANGSRDWTDTLAGA